MSEHNVFFKLFILFYFFVGMCQLCRDFNGWGVKDRERVVYTNVRQRTTMYWLKPFPCSKRSRSSPSVIAEAFKFVLVFLPSDILHYRNFQLCCYNEILGTISTFIKTWTSPTLNLSLLNGEATKVYSKYLNAQWELCSNIDQLNSPPMQFNLPPFCHLNRRYCMCY